MRPWVVMILSLHSEDISESISFSILLEPKVSKVSVVKKLASSGFAHHFFVFFFAQTVSTPEPPFHSFSS